MAMIVVAAVMGIGAVYCVEVAALAVGVVVPSVVYQIIAPAVVVDRLTVVPVPTETAKAVVLPPAGEAVGAAHCRGTTGGSVGGVVGLLLLLQPTMVIDAATSAISAVYKKRFFIDSPCRVYRAGPPLDRTGKTRYYTNRP
jgi:hypothetical protein